MIKALEVTTEGKVGIINLLPDTQLEQVQKAVGGLVQAIGLDDELTMWVNEEGKILKLPHNLFAQHLWDNTFGKDTDYIVGNMVLTGGTDSEGETMSLSDKQVLAFSLLFGAMRTKKQSEVDKTDIVEQLLNAINEAKI